MFTSEDDDHAKIDAHVHIDNCKAAMSFVRAQQSIKLTLSCSTSSSFVDLWMQNKRNKKRIEFQTRHYVRGKLSRFNFSTFCWSFLFLVRFLFWFFVLYVFPSNSDKFFIRLILYFCSFVFLWKAIKIIYRYLSIVLYYW